MIADLNKKRASAWRQGLLTTTKGNPKSNLANVMHVLSLHPDWQGVLAYDAFAETVIKLKPAPTRSTDRPEDDSAGDWTEADSVRTAAWMQTEAGIDSGAEMVTAAAITLAERHRFHPVRDWLETLEWDGESRVDALLPTYFGADDTEYTRSVGSKWMLSAVARVFQPGCQADCMLVLEGQQGRRKSTGFERLAGKEWFADTPIDLGSKDAYQTLRRKWIYEIAELDSFKGREVTKIKAFVSARIDNYRPSYARRNRDFARQVVFCGTTNESEYLTDRSGNRRFWPVRCKTDVDVDALDRDRDQLWAEAVTRYRAHERWYVDTPELRRLCEQEQEQRVPDDAWMPKVRAWLERPTVPVVGDGRELLKVEEGITTADVLFGALGLKSNEANANATQHAGRVMRDLGWQRRQVRIGQNREWRYFAPSPGEQAKNCAVTEHGDDATAEKGSCHHVTDVTSTYSRTHVVNEVLSGFMDSTGDAGDSVTDLDIEREAIQSEGKGEVIFSWTPEDDE